MTTTKPLDEVCKLFLGTSRSRPWMSQLNQFGEFVFGTDAHILIKVPKYMLSQEYPPHEKTANFDALYSNYKYNEKDIILSANGIRQILSKVEKVADSIDCSECDGDGVVTCEYDHDHDCPECDGEGVIPNSYLPKIFPRENEYIQIIDSYFSPYYINNILKVADWLEIEEIQLISYGGLRAHIFKLDAVEIVLMPTTAEGHKEKSKHKLV